MGVLSSLAQFIATLAGGLFAGAALYVTIVEHPARLESGAHVALAEFPPSYRRGARLQAPLAIAAGLAGVGAWLLGGHINWLLGGVVVFAAVPFTLVGIMPVTHKLLERSVHEDAARGMELLIRWGRLHLVRTVLGLVTLWLFLWSLVGQG